MPITQQLWTREQFKRWLNSSAGPSWIAFDDFLILIDECHCRDVNCHGWRLVSADDDRAATEKKEPAYA